jgi:hypothetical protein
MALLAMAIGTEAHSEEGKHRLDLSFTSWDGAEGDIYTALPGYTLTLKNTIRVGVSTSITKTSFDKLPDQPEESSSSSGLGDTSLFIQYDPSRRITPNPWIPDNIGLNATLIAPTGDAEEGLGGDQWLLNLGLGWAYNVFKQIYLAPSFAYETSFSDGSLAIPVEAAIFSVGIIWVTDNGFWIGYTPYLERDLEYNQWYDDHTLVMGKMWPNGFGVGIAYGRADRVDTGSVRDDYAGFLNFYYQFGD